MLITFSVYQGPEKENWIYKPINFPIFWNCAKVLKEIKTSLSLDKL